MFIFHKKNSSYNSHFFTYYASAIITAVFNMWQTQCNGKRDRAAFVSVKDFKEKNLRSDFHFLEDILQTKDSASRTLSLNCGKEQFEINYEKFNWWSILNKFASLIYLSPLRLFRSVSLLCPVYVRFPSFYYRKIISTVVYNNCMTSLRWDSY